MHSPAGIVSAATRAAAVAELFWTAPGHDSPVIEATVGTPLLLDRGPAFAFTYAESDRAHRIAASGRVVVVYSDARVSGSGWRPLAVVGRPLLTPDPDGAFFGDRLLEQELRKHPPSRALADSAMLRREHWWYLPRLIITVEVDAVEPVRERAGGPSSALLARLDDDQLEVGSLIDGEMDRLLTEDVDGGDEDVDGGAEGVPATVFGHDFTPDLEQRLTWSVRGRLVDDRLRITERVDRPRAATGLTLWQRLVRHRDLGRACRRNLRRA
jgi:hypothetical protein